MHTACRITPDMTTAGHQNRAGVATSRRPHPHLWNQTCPARLPLPIIPGFNPSDHRFGGFGLTRHGPMSNEEIRETFGRNIPNGNIATGRTSDDLNRHFLRLQDHRVAALPFPE